MSARPESTDFPSTQKLVVPRESADGFAHLRQSRDDWYIRFYLWFYNANARSINTCKLFWAYILLPITLLPGLGLHALSVIFDALPEPKARPPRPVRVGPSKAEKALDATSTRFSAIYARIGPVIKWVGIGIGVAVTVLAVITILAALASDPVIVLWTLVALAVMAAAFGLFFVAVNFFTEGSGTRFVSLMGNLARSFHTHTCAKVDLD